jgi:hypothetical protein
VISGKVGSISAGSLHNGPFVHRVMAPTQRKNAISLSEMTRRSVSRRSPAIPRRPTPESYYQRGPIDPTSGNQLVFDLRYRPKPHRLRLSSQAQSDQFVGRKFFKLNLRPAPIRARIRKPPGREPSAA